MTFGNNPQLPVAPAANSTSLTTLNMIDDLKYIDEADRALLRKDPSRFPAIFPSVKQRIIRDFREKAFNIDSQKVLECMNSYKDFEVQAFREELNDRLLRGSAATRALTIKVAEETIVSAAADSSRCQQALVTQLERNIEFCKTIKNPYLRKKYEDAIIKFIDESFDIFDRLSQHFRNFLDLKIGNAAQRGNAF